MDIPHDFCIDWISNPVFQGGSNKHEDELLVGSDNWTNQRACPGLIMLHQDYHSSIDSAPNSFLDSLYNVTKLLGSQKPNRKFDQINFADIRDPSEHTDHLEDLSEIHECCQPVPNSCVRSLYDGKDVWFR